MPEMAPRAQKWEPHPHQVQTYKSRDPETSQVSSREATRTQLLSRERAHPHLSAGPQVSISRDFTRQSSREATRTQLLSRERAHPHQVQKTHNSRYPETSQGRARGKQRELSCCLGREPNPHQSTGPQISISRDLTRQSSREATITQLMSRERAHLHQSADPQVSISRDLTRQIAGSNDNSTAV